MREGKLLEAQRLAQRTHFDLEMLREMGFATASKITRATSMGARRAAAVGARTIFRMTSCSVSTKAT